MPTTQHNEDGFPGLIEKPVPPTIHLCIILDISPSMANRWSQTISGLNEYMASLRKDQVENEQPYKVSMTTFSATVKKMYDEVELDAIPTFTDKNLQLHGWGTALYDAVGPTVKAIETTDPVLVVILTDGEENSSHHWDSDKVSKLMDERQKLGNYTYAYLGVEKEAWGQAASLGKSVAASQSNTSLKDYSSVYVGPENGLVGRTMSYSASMRSNSIRGMSMNVSNFFDPTKDQGNDVTVGVSGTPVTTSGCNQTLPTLSPSSGTQGE